MFLLSKINETKVNISFVKIILLAIILVCSAKPSLAKNKVWTIDKEKTRVQFITKRGPNTPAVGTFQNVKGSISYDGKNPETAKVNATIDTSTMKTGVNVRDEDVKSPRYLNCIKFPTATFNSKQIKKNKDGKYTIIGEFNLHGVKKLVDLNMDLPKITGKTLSTVATTRLDQRDYKLNFKAMHPDGVIRIDDVILIKILIWAR
ncbi:MAG: YceI family protein [Candidatus Melainabacteria bacterium]|nr:MAG: YceI family protein [Candidatus Melainabacteria bacterium]